jgi:hypothetical protein
VDSVLHVKVIFREVELLLRLLLLALVVEN